jgi:hypothetical protein
MYSRESSQPIPCGRCGARGTRFYTISDGERPNLCPQCFRTILKKIDSLADGPVSEQTLLWRP